MAATSGQSNTKTINDLTLAPPLRADTHLNIAVKAFDEFMVRKGFSENTVKAFRNDLKITIEFLGGETPLHHIKTEHLNDFLEWMQTGRGKPCSAKTLARRITTLKVFFGWVHEINVLGTDPAEPIVQQSVRTPLPTILTEGEIKQLRQVAQKLGQHEKKPDARPHMLLSLLTQTGIKKAECARLLITDINVADSNSPEVAIRYSEERHAHKNRRLSLQADIVPLLEQYLEQYKPETYLFECTPRNLEYVLRDLGDLAAIDHVRVGFETLRWTSAVHDFRNGVPEERLRQKMGLSPISWRDTRDKIYQLTNQE